MDALRSNVKYYLTNKIRERTDTGIPSNNITTLSLRYSDIQDQFFDILTPQPTASEGSVQDKKGGLFNKKKSLKKVIMFDHENHLDDLIH